MSYREVDSEGVLRIWSDDVERLYHTYDEAGVEILPPRAFTPEENLVADANQAREAAESAYKVRKAAVKLIVTDLVAEKNRVQLVIDKANASITGGDTKDVARAAKRIADAAIDLARLLTD
jgi:hypothetical protein